MDPCTALAVAGNVLQFVQFLGDLLNNTREIYVSATGISRENDHIRDVCSVLIDFSSRLQSPRKPPPRQKTGPEQQSQYGQALIDCAAACSADCQELIRTTEKLKCKAGGKATRCWRSFRAALAEIWKSGEIDELRKRVADRQHLIVLHLYAVSRLIYHPTSLKKHCLTLWAYG